MGTTWESLKKKLHSLPVAIAAIGLGIVDGPLAANALPALFVAYAKGKKACGQTERFE
jgi:hypothetical protein